MLKLFVGLGSTSCTATTGTCRHLPGAVRRGRDVHWLASPSGAFLV
jgi:hypothetical protein